MHSSSSSVLREEYDAVGTGRDGADPKGGRGKQDGRCGPLKKSFHVGLCTLDDTIQ
jgi:hypothetical protein